MRTRPNPSTKDNFIKSIDNDRVYIEVWTDECIYDLRSKGDNIPLYPSHTNLYTKKEWVEEGREIVETIILALEKELGAKKSLDGIVKCITYAIPKPEVILDQNMNKTDADDIIYTYASMQLVLEDIMKENEEAEMFAYGMICGAIDRVVFNNFK